MSSTKLSKEAKFQLVKYLETLILLDRQSLEAKRNDFSNRSCKNPIKDIRLNHKNDKGKV